MISRTNGISLKGITVCNPVDIDREYLLKTVDYAIVEGFNHIQYVGPIHDGIKGNIDGMIMFEKYSLFNNDKDIEYVKKSISVLNEACEVATKNNVDIYVWHHELDLPLNFTEIFPETKNSLGDIEVTHPIVRDFIECRITEFFMTYPKIKGLVLTLHETKVPLLKLRQQKLDKIDRIKYVTGILYEICKKMGKELIVRPFASTEQDYNLLMQAYESISNELIVMDKWTQFDWSLTLPPNAFFNKIKTNPLVAETDIFGEYFGKGMLPLMLKNHIRKNFTYCETHSPIGYCSRIDRNGYHPFEDVNEVNINIMNACLNNQDVDKTIDDFFIKRYPQAPFEVRELMEETEELQIKIFNLHGFYFSELSRFPTLNHCKNHYYFEILKNNCTLSSNEWYIPVPWKQEPAVNLIKEKEDAVVVTEALLKKVKKLEGIIGDREYHQLWTKFSNLKFVSQIWYYLLLILYDYTQFFEAYENKYEISMRGSIESLSNIQNIAKCELGEDFYCTKGNAGLKTEFINNFISDILQSFEIEKNLYLQYSNEPALVDYIVCGGAVEGHCLKKEVNFSDTLIHNGELCRVPGSLRGSGWCSVNAHGWFSYKLKVVPNRTNTIKVTAGNPNGNLEIKITVGNDEYEFHKKVTGKTDLVFDYIAENSSDSVIIRFDKIASDIPFVYDVQVY